MGLGPWAGKKRADAQMWGYGKPISADRRNENIADTGTDNGTGTDTGTDIGTTEGLSLGQDFFHRVSIMEGNPYDDSFQVNWAALEGLGEANTWKGGEGFSSAEGDSRFGEYANLAASVQQDLEKSALALVQSLQQASGEENLCVVGGVALNSVLNGRLLRESGFKNVFVPPGPGDEGIAVGCAIYGLQRTREEAAFNAATATAGGGGEQDTERDKKEESMKGVNVNVDVGVNAEEEKDDFGATLTAGSDRALSKALAMFGGGEADPVTQSLASESSESSESAPIEVIEAADTPSGGRDNNEINERAEDPAPKTVSSPVPLPKLSFSPYSGRDFSDKHTSRIIEELAPWINAEYVMADSTYLGSDSEGVGSEGVRKGTLSLSLEDILVDSVADRISQGQVIGWFQGRSEFGQRALGHRSILADPRSASARSFINTYVKQREWWRPLAPSVLDEFAGDWFEGLQNHGNASPFMSLTATLKEDKAAEVPSVAHIDGSARLQTVTSEDSPLYHKLISAFYKKTGVPMVR